MENDNPIKKDTELIYDKVFNEKVFKKTIRICNGAFYLADTIYEKDSANNTNLKRKIRESSEYIIDVISDTLTHDITYLRTQLPVLHAALLKLLSYIELAAVTDRIQRSHSLSMSFELTSLVDDLYKFREKSERRLPAQDRQKTYSTQSNVGVALRPGRTTLPTSQQVEYVEAGVSALSDESSERYDGSESASSREGMAQRKDRILSIMRDKGQVSIKDISDIIRDVSEKSIQRDLNDLIDSGSVVRIGERRWSTYKII
jgi:DNA-binding transcriptional ArsR family regulator